MPFILPSEVGNPENRKAWSQHPPCQRVIDAIRQRPGASSTQIAQITGFQLKEVRRVLWHLWKKDPRRIVVRRRSVSAYYINRNAQPRKPKPRPPAPVPPFDLRKQPIFRRGGVAR